MEIKFEFGNLQFYIYNQKAYCLKTFNNVYKTSNLICHVFAVGCTLLGGFGWNVDVKNPS